MTNRQYNLFVRIPAGLLLAAGTGIVIYAVLLGVRAYS
jgi:hypothetical protein